MGCKGCGGEFVKGSFFNPPDTFEGAIDRAVAKVRSGTVSAVRLTDKGKIATVERVMGADGKDVVAVTIEYPDGTMEGYPAWRE